MIKYKIIEAKEMYVDMNQEKFDEVFSKPEMARLIIERNVNGDHYAKVLSPDDRKLLDECAVGSYQNLPAEMRFGSWRWYSVLSVNNGVPTFAYFERQKDAKEYLSSKVNSI